jgi:hypothetical protein
MKLKYGLIGAGCSIVGLILTGVQVVDSIVNGNTRAAIAGEAAGRAAVEETAKRHHKTIFGTVEVIDDPQDKE